MKIIKAIWKSNEVPTNEYFLWLKHEAKGFVLYVRGQQGWEPITSEGQISDVYTKEEIDAILEDYYKKTESDEKYLPLSAGEQKALTGPLYTRAIRPAFNGATFGTKENKYIPYTFSVREFYDFGRWGVKRVWTCIAEGESQYANVGIIDLEVPDVPMIKYRITISEMFENSSIKEIQAVLYMSPTGTFHSGTAVNSIGNIEVKTGKTANNKLHLMIGQVNKGYPNLTTIEIDAITTVAGSVDVDTVYQKLQPSFVTDYSIYHDVNVLTPVNPE
jgi:hypothetical protein